MASFSFAALSQPAGTQRSNGDPRALSASRTSNSAASNDPLQPLRAMADRVGKEVEKFAERVDHWHTHGNDTPRAKYQSTVKMVGKFRDVAELNVKELKKAHAAENKGELERSVRRRIQTMADSGDANAQSMFGQSLQKGPSSVVGPESSQLRDLRSWQEELATWELVRLMIEQHHPEPETDPAAEKQKKLRKVGANGRYSPNSEIWDRFILEDDKAKEKAIVLRWLEQTARNDRSDIEQITAELEGQSGKGAHTWTSGWLDTKSKIKQAKRLEGADKPLNPESTTLKTADRTQDLVTQLDPDGPARQKRTLEKSDDYYERALWLVCYEMLRRGKSWKDICDWAQERNEAWRGVSVGAAYEAHPNGGPNVAGATAGYLFRRMCFYASRGARIPYEGAVYGLLSGDLKQVQAVCQQSWDDHLHAHYNALLLSRFDTYLQQKYPSKVSRSLTQKFVFQDAVANIGSWEHASQKVIAALKQQKATERQALSPFKLIQGALIAGDFEELLVKVGTSLADMFEKDKRTVNLMLHPDTNENDPGPAAADGDRKHTAEQYYQTLASDPFAFRIIVHAGIALRRGIPGFATNGLEDGTEFALDNVIAGYIEFLRVSKRIQLIPLYAAQLEGDRAAHLLARIVPDIKNSEEQRRSVNLMEQYRIDVVEVVSQTFLFASKHSGFTHFDEDDNTVITKPISRFKILDHEGVKDSGLWPGFRILDKFEGSAIEDKEDAVIEALQWYHYVGSDFDRTFLHLRNALLIFLLNGRFGAAERIVGDLSIETLSLSRTEALCGYPFDFLQPGAEEQDEGLLHEHRTNLSNASRQTSSRPTAQKHAAIVNSLREHSAPYFELQQIVRLLVLFREWRHEEDELIKTRQDQHKSSPAGSKKKADMGGIKDLLENIEAVFTNLMATVSDNIALQLSTDKDSWNVKKAYFPDIVLAYISVLQTAAFFIQRDSAVNSAVKAMEVANLVADDDYEWLQRAFLETGRMSELVQALASVSKAMLRLNEHEPKKTAVKKRGSRGETLRIWDLRNAERL